MASYILFVVIAPAILGLVQGTTKCYQCASPQLKENWQLTSFPGKIEDAGFLFDCGATKAMSSFNGIPQVDCQTECVTYYFTFPSSAGGATDPGLIVRGCYGYLMGQTNYVRQTKDSCYWGYSQALDRITNGKITVRGEIKFGSSDLSNGAGAGWTATCNNNTAVSCYQCETSSSSDCTSGSCSGQACYKSYSTFNGKRSVKKGCAGVNVYQENACMNINTDVIIPQRSRAPRAAAVNYRSRTCYCGSNQCNGVGTMAASTSILSLVLFSASRLL